MMSGIGKATAVAVFLGLPVIAAARGAVSLQTSDLREPEAHGAPGQEAPGHDEPDGDSPNEVRGDPDYTPRIEVVFALDTTGSMSGLIAAAKEKIWSIANTLARTDPAPDIKMGLVGYRDRGDAYVTQLTALSDDLDAVYSKLMAFGAKGGGDGPESVNQALDDAVTRIEWNADSSVYRVIFLVGDYPPHMDYADDVKYQATCRLAAESGIVINTIQCGRYARTTPVWREIARLAGGSYFRVEQSGSAVLASTPYDKELAALARELDGTRVHYGSAGDLAEIKKREDIAGVIYASASVEAQSRRAIYNGSAAGEKNFTGFNELVSDVAGGKVKLAEVKDAELPAEMRRMSHEEREAHIEERSKRRDGIRVRIEELAERRQEHIKTEMARAGKRAEDSLDEKVYKAVKVQAKAKGIDYRPAEASY
ncbi:MAG: vWA domain-containing protein [Planctomycetota bacterium]|jgi:Mg-chelatase subunit ChlD